jgi:uncharacterized protein YukE
MTIQSSYQEFPNHLSEAKRLLDDTSGELEAVKDSFREKATTLCRTMTPKESFEFRLRSEQVVNPGLAWDPDESVVETGVDYKYKINFYQCYDLKRDFRKFVEEDDRYTVEWGMTELPSRNADDSFGKVLVHFMPKGPAVLASASKKQKGHRTIMSIQSKYQEFPNHLAEAKQLLDDTSAELEAVKDSFREKATTLCRTMTPKEAFEFRLRSEQDVNPGLYWDPDEAVVETGVDYEYKIKFLHCYELNRDFKYFVGDDDRYTVEWEEAEVSCKYTARSCGTMPVHVHFMPTDDAVDDYDEEDNDGDMARMMTRSMSKMTRTRSNGITKLEYK